MTDYNIQLTSLSALQSSMDILRKHRPDYTPRTGFVWPITDPSMTGDAHKKREFETESQLTEGPSDTQQDKRIDAPKRQQNTMLLMNAMKTTAAHSKSSFSSTSFSQSHETLEPDTPVTTTMRSSATPAPASQDTLQKGSSSNLSQEGTRGPIGGGKKKKKRAYTRYPHFYQSIWKD